MSWYVDSGAGVDKGILSVYKEMRRYGLIVRYSGNATKWNTNLLVAFADAVGHLDNKMIYIEDDDNVETYLKMLEGFRYGNKHIARFCLMLELSAKLQREFNID